MVFLRALIAILFAYLVLQNSSVAEASHQSGCKAIEDFGGGVEQKDNVDALLAARAALPSRGGCLKFGAGTYNFAKPVALVLPPLPFSLTIEGVGETATRLNWTSRGDGLAVHGTSQFNTVHFRDLSISTDAAGGGKGLILDTTADLGVLGISDIERVTFKGSDGGNAKAYWSIDLQTGGISYLNLIGDTFMGARKENGTFLGIGAIIEGGPRPGQYAIVYNFSSCSFEDVDRGLIYGSFVQGVTINQTNFQNGGSAIGTMPGEKGVLAELLITNSQFGNQTRGNFEFSAGAVAQIGLSNNLIFVSKDATGLDLGAGYYFANITGNTFSGIRSSSRAIALGDSRSSVALVAANIFSNFQTGIDLLPRSSLAKIDGSNVYYDVGKAVVDKGTGNDVEVSVEGRRRMNADLRLQAHLDFVPLGGPPAITLGCPASLDANASDGAGEIRIFGLTRTCTMSFHKPYQSPPRCIVSSPTGSALTAYRTTPRELVIDMRPTAGATFDYICVGP